MQIDTRITWEKLAIELDLINLEDPNSLLPLFIGINSLLTDSTSLEWCHRKINFMSYELNAKCEGLGETDRVHILNDYFFDQKNFQIYPINAQKADHLFLSTILNENRGSSLPMSILYLHLANQLDLPIYFINLPHSHIVKWVRGNESSYLDLSRGGISLSDQDLLVILNRTCKIDKESCLDILPSKTIVQNYVENFSKLFRAHLQPHSELIALNILIKLKPSSLNFLRDRALLLKALNQPKEALADLKRYFSFIDKDHAPGEVLMAFHELNNLFVNSDFETKLLH